MWPKETLERIRDSLPDQSTWQALYQQNPQAKRGNMFQRDRWVVIGDEPDDIVQRDARMDLAGSSNKGDWTVGVLLGRTAPRDRRVGRETPQVLTVGVEELIAQTAADDGPAVQIRMELPKGDANVTLHHYSQLLAGYEFKGTPSSGTRLLAPNCSRQRTNADSCRSWTGSGPTGTSTNSRRSPAAGTTIRLMRQPSRWGVVGPDRG